MGDKRVLDLQDDTTLDFPYQIFQLQTLQNHRQNT